MSLLKLICSSRAWRLAGAASCIALFLMIGCFDPTTGAAGGGCVQGGGNDNVVDNDNDGTAGNDNGVSGNDNTPANDNGTTNDNEDENDNGDPGTGNGNGSAGNDNTGTSGNDNRAGNDNAASNDNTGAGNDNQTSNANDNTGAGNTNTNANGNTNVNSNTGGGGGTGGNTNNNTGGGTVQTKTSGAAQPGETVQLDLIENLPAACYNGTQWMQTSPATPAVTLVNATMGGVTFVAPTVTTSTNFTFSVTTTNCPNGTMGTATVSVQVATATWVNLPTCIDIGDSIDLDAFIGVTGQPNPPESLVLVTVEENAMAGFSFNPATNILTANSGNGETLSVILQVFGTAGLLDEATDTITIMTTCP